MFMLRLTAVGIVALMCGASGAFAQTPGLGKPISEPDIKAWDIAVLPDGSNLPPGSGTSAQGASIYAEILAHLVSNQKRCRSYLLGTK